MKKQLLLLFCLGFSLFIVQAQVQTDPSAKFGKAYFKSYISDTKQIVAAPVQWNNRQWLTAAAVFGAGAIVYSFDMPVYEFFQRNRNGFTNSAAKYALEPWGSGVYSMSVMGLLYLHGTFAKNDRSKTTALLGLKTFLLTGAIANIAKQTFHRHRPFQEQDYALKNGTKMSPYKWDGPVSNIHYTSFPSGHTTSVFAMATLIASEYRDKPFVPYLAYGIAAFTGLSRINDSKHWASDVLIGAAFGYAMAKLIHNKNNWGTGSAY